MQNSLSLPNHSCKLKRLLKRNKKKNLQNSLSLPNHSANSNVCWKEIKERTCKIACLYQTILQIEKNTKNFIILLIKKRTCKIVCLYQTILANSNVYWKEIKKRTYKIVCPYQTILQIEKIYVPTKIGFEPYKKYVLQFRPRTFFVKKL